VLTPSADALLSLRRLDRREAFQAILGHARAPGVLVEKRRALQLSVASRLAALPAVEVSFTPGRDSPGSVASAIALWPYGA
jgi:hypothetical protein